MQENTIWGVEFYSKLSADCGQNKYWVNNIENGRTKTISEESAHKIFEALDAIEHNRVLDDFLKKIESGEADASLAFFAEDGKNIEELEGGEHYHFDAEQHKKELKKQMNVAHNKMLKLLEKIDYDDANSIMKYETYIRTYIALLTSIGGQAFFRKIMKYPLHFASYSCVDGVQKKIKDDAMYEYMIKKDENGKPYMMVKSLISDEENENLFG